jgi:hypothetical protein
MSFLGKGTDMYVKEEAFKFQDEGRYDEARQILSDIFSKQELLLAITMQCLQ